MASRTLEQLIILTARQAGLPVIDDAFNSSGNATTKGQADNLKIYPDNSFIGQHLYLNSGSPTITAHIVKAFTQSSGELEWYTALGAAPDSIQFLILPFARSVIVDAIVDTVNRLHDDGSLVRNIVSTGLVGGSPLYNAGWDYWTSSSVVDGWARNGTGTVARERASGNIWTGAQSVKLSTTADYIALSEPWKRFLEDFKGETVRMFCPVLASNASHARIALYDGTTINYSSYHTGGGGWEILDTTNLSISATASDLEPRLYNDDTNAVYFGRPWIVGGVGVRDYPFPAQLFTKINQIVYHSVSLRPDGDARSPARQLGTTLPLTGHSSFVTRDEATSSEVGIIRFNKVPPAEHVLELHASTVMAVPSADADQVEVDQAESYLIADIAAARLLEDQAMRVQQSSREVIQRTASRLRSDAEQIRVGLNRVRAKAPRLQMVP